MPTKPTFNESDVSEKKLTRSKPAREENIMLRGVDAVKSWVADVDPARAAMLLGLALVVAILGGLGIKDDLLLSMIRNLPVVVFVALSLVLVGLALPYFKKDGKGSHALTVIGFVLLLGGALTTVYVAVNSLTVREQPILSATPKWSAETPGNVTVTFASSATSLLARDNLFLRVIGVRTSKIEADLYSVCNSPSTNPPEGAELLFRGVSGPAESGNASISIDIPIQAGEFDVVCGYAALRAPDGNDNITDRWGTIIVDLGRVPAITVSDPTEPSSTPSPSATPQ